MDVRAVIVVSTADVPVFGCLVDAPRVASVESACRNTRNISLDEEEEYRAVCSLRTLWQRQISVTYTLSIS